MILYYIKIPVNKDTIYDDRQKVYHRVHRTNTRSSDKIAVIYPLELKKSIILYALSKLILNQYMDNYELDLAIGECDTDTHTGTYISNQKYKIRSVGQKCLNEGDEYRRAMRMMIADENRYPYINGRYKSQNTNARQHYIVTESDEWLGVFAPNSYGMSIPSVPFNLPYV